MESERVSKYWTEAELGTNMGTLREKLCETLRVVTGKFREVLRKSAMLRIVTGKTNFFDKEANKAGTRKNERSTTDDPAAACVINFEFTRKPGGMGIPLPKMKRCDKTRRMTPRSWISPRWHYPAPFHSGVLWYVAEGKWCGVNF